MSMSMTCLLVIRDRSRHPHGQCLVCKSGDALQLGLNPTSDIKTPDSAPPPIAFAAPREARGSQGWTARAPSTTLSAKEFSVSPRISICDRANMALWLKGQTARTRFRSTDETLFGREASLAHDPDGSGHRS